MSSTRKNRIILAVAVTAKAVLLNRLAARIRRHRRHLVWAASLIASALLIYWLLSGFSMVRFTRVLVASHPPAIALLFIALLAEQWLRAWKWRLVLDSRTRSADHFLATMVGYLPGLTIGLGSSVLARAWIIAQKYRLRTATVIGSVVVDRLIDAAVFAVIALGVLLLPMPQGLSGAGGVAVVVTILAIMTGAALFGGAVRKWRVRRFEGQVGMRLRRLLPARISSWLSRHAETFAAGLTWPRAAGSRVLVIFAALLIKTVAISEMLWAGWAVGVWLAPGDYLLIMVLLGSLVFLGFFMRVPGSTLLAGIFILTLFGISREQAAAMMLLTQGNFLLITIMFGGLGWWTTGLRGSLPKRRDTPL